MIYDLKKHSVSQQLDLISHTQIVTHHCQKDDEVTSHADSAAPSVAPSCTSTVPKPPSPEPDEDQDVDMTQACYFQLIRAGCLLRFNVHVPKLFPLLVCELSDCQGFEIYPICFNRGGHDISHVDLGMRAPRTTFWYHYRGILIRHIFH